MRHVIRILCIVAGSIWLITSLYVSSNPALNPGLRARKPEDAQRAKLMLTQLQSLKNDKAPLTDICLQYRLLAIDYFAANDYDKAENTLFDCLGFLKAHSDRHSALNSYCLTYNMLADLWLARADFANAESFYHKAKECCAADSFLLAKTTNNLGVLYYLWGEATSDKETRSDRLSLAKTLFQAAIAQVKAKPEGVDKADLEFFQDSLSSNYQSCLNELTYCDSAVASLR